MSEKASESHRRRRNNLRLAFAIALVALLFYVLMFVVLSQGG